MRFLVIPEDFRYDQYILQPILTQLLVELGFANPKLRVCLDPLMGGVGEALKPERLREVFQRYQGMIDVFILCVDRDADQHRHLRLSNLENEFPKVRLLAHQAWEELETWALAGLDLPRGMAWAAVRAHRDVKEAYFRPLAESLGLKDAPGGGRRQLGQQAASRVGRIRQLCPEDFDALATRLAALR